MDENPRVTQRDKISYREFDSLEYPKSQINTTKEKVLPLRCLSIIRNSLLVVLLRCLCYSARHFNKRKVMTGPTLNSS